MAFVFNTDINSLYGTKVATEAAYQAPGTYGLASSAIQGVIESITVTAGTGYTSTPSFAITADAGSGATFSVRMKMLTAVLNAAGTGYAPGENVTLAVTGGTVATRPVVTISTTKLVSATIADGGTGYGNTQTFDATVVGGTGATAAQVSVTSNAGGVITTVNSVSTAGSYTANASSPAATTGGSGTGLTLNLVFGINTFTISNAGLATVIGTAATQHSTVGAGTGATFQTMTWGVDSVAVTAGGSAYSGSVTGAFTGGGGSGATAVVVMANAEETRILTLIELLRSYFASVSSAEEAQIARDVIWRMLARVNTGGSFDAAAVASAMQRAGVVRFIKRPRTDF